MRLSFTNGSALTVLFTLWLILVEGGVELWYRSHERHRPPAIKWTPQFPRENPTFRDVPISPKTRQLLRYDEASNATWIDCDTRWQLIFLRWNPGRTAPQLARSHTPEVCLTATGKRLLFEAEPKYLTVGRLQLPFRSYVFDDRGRRLHVFYCLWEDRAPEPSFDTSTLTYGNRFAAVLAGRRNLGQRSLEIAVWGFDDCAQAESAMLRQLHLLHSNF